MATKKHCDSENGSDILSSLSSDSKAEHAPDTHHSCRNVGLSLISRSCLYDTTGSQQNIDQTYQVCSYLFASVESTRLPKRQKLVSPTQMCYTIRRQDQTF